MKRSRVLTGVSRLSVVLAVILTICSSLGARAENLAAPLWGAEGDGYGLSVAMDAANNPVLVHFNERNKLLKVTRAVKCAWSTAIVRTVASVSDTAVVVKDGTIHVFYLDENGYIQHLFQEEGGEWANTIAPTEVSASGEISAALCAGSICLTFYDPQNKTVKFARENSEQWDVSDIAVSTSGAKAMNSLAVTSVGLPVVVFYDATERRPKVASQNAEGQWAIDTLTYGEEDFGVDPFLLIDEQDGLHISSGSVISSEHLVQRGLYYSKKQNGVWTTVELPRNYIHGPSVIAVSGETIQQRYLLPNVPIEEGTIGIGDLWWEREIIANADHVSDDNFLFNQMAVTNGRDGAVFYAFQVTMPVPVVGDYRGIGYYYSLGNEAISPYCETASAVSSEDSASTPLVENASSESAGDLSSSQESDLLIDRDGDGLSDVLEREYKTDPLDSDTDDDGVNDGQEIVEGTNPLDRGSNVVSLGKKFCVEWNNSSKGANNTLEIVNVGETARRVKIKMQDHLGKLLRRWNHTLEPKTIKTISVNEEYNEKDGAYGRVCVEHDGNRGDVIGQMVYKLSEDKVVLVLPVSHGLVGEQVVNFGTPNANGTQQNYFVENWIQLTSVSDTIVRGKLLFYNNSGRLIKGYRIRLSSGGRIDLPGHQLGQGLFGLVRWQPAENNSATILRNMVYTGERLGESKNYYTVSQWEGAAPTGEDVLLPYDISEGRTMVQVTNALARVSTVYVSFYRSNGTVQKRMTFKLKPFSSRNLSVANYVRSSVGLIKLKANRPNSLHSALVCNKFETSGKILREYRLQSREAANERLVSAYRLGAGDQATVLIANSGGLVNGLSVKIYRYRAVLGKERANGTMAKNIAAQMNPNGLYRQSFTASNEFGALRILRIQSKKGNRIAAWVLHHSPEVN